MLRLYDTLSREVSAFKPIRPGSVRYYSCGPTVYDYAHIGNLRAYVFTDTLRRCLEHAGYEVVHVMNITDVGHLVSDNDEGQDKLEKGAQREGSDVWSVAERYIQAFKDDMARLNVLPPNGYHGHEYARATDFIDEQIELVRILLDKGFAYQTQQAIYFEVSKLPDYGELSGQRLADKSVGARSDVVTDTSKRGPHDFAVWFFASGRFEGHAMQWPSPWGNGFPGWHLECSAIIHTALGDPIDIHTGGVDHIGTHHTNEIAQTEAAYGNKLANYWLHNEFVLVDGGRMGKSLQNAYTLQDIVDKGFSPSDFRLLCLQAHYRSELHFSWDNLEAARNRRRGLQNLADLRWQAGAQTTADPQFDALASGITDCMNNDMNTPRALALLSDYEDKLNGSGLASKDEAAFISCLELLDKLLGLDLLGSNDISDSQKALLQKRAAAREAKDWRQSDELRDRLAAEGIAVRDTKTHEQLWTRT